ncbi:putative cytidine deaminase [Rosa chinensis]|uniref:cytidine deaminase n=1 Tax=Rosa chinensis TaxID=74649 RepID=A0A2P6RK60_ROSCH|nr:cytidine deaminase 1 [Rosa chinensis]PRQ46820.1 putative cytidine deaminase [Rosa chinensis]
MDRPRFVIEASEAESAAKQKGLTVVQHLPSLVESAKDLARVPISKFPVGAVGYGSSGRVFFGVNLEFPGLPLHYSVHAEQFLVTNLSIQSEPRLEYVAVSAAPCGHCRQFFQEIRRAQDIKILITSAEAGDDRDDTLCGQFSPLRHLLPHRFGPEDLLDEDVPLVLEKHNNGLSFSNKPETFSDDLINHALEAANRSHAPYSLCPSGVAILDGEGKIYKGWYMESAAYNPSMGPVQAALVDYIVGGGGGYEEIVAAVLVEKEGALVKQEQAARLLLQTISPKVEFRVLHCK